MRLPPLRILRVRNPNKPVPNPCLTVMSSVLGLAPPPRSLSLSPFFLPLVPVMLTALPRLQ